jgi:hypothetical protein
MTLKVDGTNGVLQAYDYQVLTTGFSYTFAAGTQTLFMAPAGTLATGTVTMPASPVDGMVITFSSSQQITALTVSANTGQSIVAGGSVMLAQNASLSYTYRLANTTWYPYQNASFAIGVGQTWQNVAASRAVGTTYTNSTGRPITVLFSPNASGGLITYANLNGVSLAFVQFTPSGGGGASPFTLIVPNGATYSFANGANTTIGYWFELR